MADGESRAERERRERRAAERRRDAAEERRKEEAEESRYGGGAIGAWTEEELERLPELMDTPPSEEAEARRATRDQDNPEVLRKGDAIEGRRKRVGAEKPGDAEPYEDEGPVTGKTPGRRSVHPGERGVRRGEEERER